MTLAAVAALTAGLTPAKGDGGGGRLDLALCAPDRNRFTLDIDNRYFPLPVGQRSVFTAVDEETAPPQTLGLQITVLDETEVLYRGHRKVITRVVEEREWVDANQNHVLDEDATHLIEVARNYFAQTRDGTVCYFGEAVEFYEGGVVVDDQGSWRADDRGNAPGIYMPADPKPGMTFQQEVAPEVAMDEATITGKGTVTVPAGTFRNALLVTEVNPLENPPSTSEKAYGRNVGLIKDSEFELVKLFEGDDD
jgi:hypothetical protein